MNQHNNLVFSNSRHLFRHFYADNKWVKLSKIVPWDSFATLYMNAMDKQMGRPGLSPRIVLGALIIKHRKKLEEMIDQLYELKGKQGIKPRTCRRKINKAYAVYSKGRNKSKSEIRKMKRKLLECVNRDIKHINQMLDDHGNVPYFPLSRNYQRLLWIINTVYEQQRQMYDTQDNTCKHRIVSIFQPHVRPIKRGKQGKDTEFGAKLVVSLDNGFARLNNISWDAYNESSDLIKQIEGKFGQGKNGYELNKIRARLRSTSESWISCIFFIMNLLKLEKEFLFAFFKSVLLYLLGLQKTKNINFIPDYVISERKMIQV